MMISLPTDEGELASYINNLPSELQDRVYEAVEHLRELFDADQVAVDYAMALIVAERTGVCLYSFKGH